jgi:hypothetical protein
MEKRSCVASHISAKNDATKMIKDKKNLLLAAAFAPVIAILMVHMLMINLAVKKQSISH